MQFEQKNAMSVSKGDILEHEGSLHLILAIEEFFEEFSYVGVFSFTEDELDDPLDIGSQTLLTSINFYRLNGAKQYAIVEDSESEDIEKLQEAVEEQSTRIKPLTEFVSDDNEQSSLDSYSC